MPAVENVIETDRLRLVPLSLAHAAAIVNGHRQRGARWETGYPTEGTLVAAGIVVTAQGEGRDLGPYTVYQVVRRSDGMIVGDCGFDGPPDGDGVLHLAFGIAFAARGHGYAAEAVRGLLDWAGNRDDIRRVTAEVNADQLGAIAVMERAGMRCVRRRRRLLSYEF